MLHIPHNVGEGTSVITLSCNSNTVKRGRGDVVKSLTTSFESAASLFPADSTMLQSFLLTVVLEVRRQEGVASKRAISFINYGWDVRLLRIVSIRASRMKKSRVAHHNSRAYYEQHR